MAVFDAFEISGGRIVYCSGTGQTLLFELDSEEDLRRIRRLRRKH